MAMIWGVRKTTPSCWWHIAGLCLLPGVVWVVLGLPKMHAASFSDAYYYFAYAHNFVDLVERYGMIYYAVRFGAIFPDWLFGALLGPVAGFLVLRYLLCVATCVALFLFFSSRYTVLAGWFAAAFWMFNPFVLKMMLSPYVTSTAVPFSLLGLLLLLLQTQHSIVSQKSGVCRYGVVSSMGAGALFCLSATSNIFAAITIGFGGLAWMIWTMMLGWRAIVFGLLGCAVGAGLTLCVAMVVYGWLFDMPHILMPTIDSIVSLGSGGSSNWTRPIADWLADSPMIFAPPLLAVAGVFLGWRERERALIAFSIALIGMTGFYWWLDLFRDGYALSFWPYFQFLLPLMVFVAAESCGVVVARSSAMSGRWVMAVAVMVLSLGGWQFAKRSFPSLNGWSAWVAVGIALMALPFLLNSRLRTGIWGGIFVICVGLTALTARIPLDPGRVVRDDMSIALAGMDLTAIMRKFADKRDCRFWYSGTFEDTVTLVQSAQLNFFSRIGLQADFPIIDDSMTADLLSSCESNLLILGTPDEVDAGLRSLEQHEIPFQELGRQTVEREEVKFDVAVCRISAANHYDWAEMDLWLPSDTGRQQIQVIKKSDFVTGEKLWDGKLLGVIAMPPGELVNSVRLTLSVDSGRVQIVALSADATLADRELASIQVGRTSGMREVHLTFPVQKERILLVIQNAWVSGVPSRGLIDTAYVGKLRSPMSR